jgi:prepilin-type N-terminal cleavage/methylation domain-containing protein
MTARAPSHMRTKRRRRHERGLTLIEMLMALALLGFILLGILPLFMGSVKSNYSANEYTSIHNLCRDRLEELMNLRFNDPQLSVGEHNVSDLPPVLPDPMTGVPPAAGGVVNPFTLIYQVKQYQAANIDPSKLPAPPASGAAFTPVRIVVAGSIYQFKRIEVTAVSGYQLVDSATNKWNMTGFLGFGARVARVAGILENPDPANPLNQSVVDPGP